MTAALRQHWSRWLHLLALVCSAGCLQQHSQRSPEREDEGWEAPVPGRPQRDASVMREPWPDTDQPADSADDCEAPSQLCGGNCIDVSTSTRHCGSCNSPCLSPRSCVEGSCQLKCSEGLSVCGSRCVDTKSDRSHCGACDVTCSAEQTCSAGLCTCPSGTVLCSGKCQQPRVGACGVCGDTCPEEAACDDGQSHVADWPTLGGDMLRSGYNAGERGTPPLTESWSVSLISDPLNPVMISGKRVFASGQTRFRERGPLFALDLESGKQLWMHDFGAVSSVGQPSVVNCRVYLQQSKGMSSVPSRIWALTADQGAVIWNEPFTSQWEHFWSPTVTPKGVFANGGAYGGFYGFSRGSGATLFFNKMLAQYDEWVAAAFGDDLYTFVEGKLRRHSADTGEILDTISVTWNWAGWSMSTGPVFAPSGVVYIVAPPTLYAFEALSKRLVFSHSSNHSGMAALAEGHLLALDSQQLTSFDAASGALQWRADDTEGLLHAPIAAHGFAYASSRTTTYAVDLSDGRVVWRVAVGGWVSVGGGRLFIAGYDGILHSYALSQAP